MIESAMLEEEELRTPLDAFSYQLKRQATHVAMVQPMGNGELREYTWEQLGEQVQKMAGYLVSLNLEPGSNIALISKNCVEWIMADLAIWMAGHVSVPLYPTLMADNVRYVLDHSEARHAFIGKLDDWKEISKGVSDDVHCIAFELASPEARGRANAHWEKIMASQTPLDEWVERRDDELATIIYTSGTTGKPKGVMHNFGALKAVGNRAAHAYELSAEDRVISYLPLAHVAERVAVETAFLYVGMTVYFAESLETFADDIKRARPTVFFAVPRIWSKFYQKAGERLPPEKLKRLLSVPIVNLFVRRKVLAAMGLDKCRIALSGAAALSQELINWFKSLGLEVLEVYGMTENLAWSHTTPEGGQRIGFVGTPNDTVECRLGDGGEIQVKSPGSMMGYYKEEEMSRDAFADDVWLRTGDVGEIDDDGYLRITGRLKELYKTEKGKYVAPSPIEARLASLPGVEQACVMGEGLPQSVGLVDLGEEERAALRQDETATRSRLEAAFDDHLQEINASLDPHERLDALVVIRESWTVDNEMTTPTLKVKRKAIESTFGDRVAAWQQQGGIIWE